MSNPLKKVNFTGKRFGGTNSSLSQSSTDKLHYLWVLLPLIIAALIYTAILITFHHLPEGVYNEKGSNAGRFVGGRARSNLEILSNIGPRLVGSISNEIQTIGFLRNAVETIRNESLSLHTIEYDIQTASGSYIIDDMVNVYQNIKNFVVRFQSVFSNSTSALLLNSHFDTVPESSGSGDDGTMVAVMLEILRVLSKSKETLKHPIIFLFNGAEENSLQGSHAFITQHKWVKDIKAFINLDVAGIGGKEMLFQSGPGHPWLMEHYSKSVVHPFALTIAEEVFQNNFIPSDTDFRIFRDYGKIPGLDLANTLNGYVYHTKYDRIANGPAAPSLQNTGDNILALVKSMASSDELQNPSDHADGHIVFFDFLGLFLISYTETEGLAINITVSVVSLTTIAISIWSIWRTINLTMKFILKKFILYFVLQVATVALSIAISIVLALIIDVANAPLSWFSRPWLIFGLYFCPFVFSMAIVPAFSLNYKRKLQERLPLRYGNQLFLHSQCIILIILIILMTSFSIRSAFVITIAVLFYTVSLIINTIGGLQHRPFLWLIPILISQLLPFAFYSYLSLIIYSVFIPITGRSGSTSQSDLMIAAFTIIVGLLISSFLAPLFSICRKSKTIISGFLVILGIFGIILATPLGFPFTERTAAERHWIFHTGREFRALDGSLAKADSGYMVLPLDRYSPISIENILSKTKYSKTGNDCSNMLVCGVPVYSPEFKPLSNYSYWIAAEPPSIDDDHMGRLRLLSKRNLNETVIRFNFEIFGPAHMQIFFNPKNRCQLTNWSLVDGFPKKDYFEESTYFIHFRHGLDDRPFQFYLDFKVPEHYNGEIFDIALISHHNNYPIVHTAEFKEFLATFPKWACITPIVSTFYSLKF